MNSRFALIGPGRVGAAIARTLFEKGFQPVAIIGRNAHTAHEACSFIGCDVDLATTDLHAAAPAKLILIAVPDDQIAAVARQLHLKQIAQSDSVLLHFSGVHPAAIMRQPQGQTFLFSLHPLLPFADRKQAYERLSRVSYFGEGDVAAYSAAATLCNALGGQLQFISSQMKHLYHAAACLASNYLVTLIAEAGSLLEECGIDPARGDTCLLPLLEATLHNVATCGTKKGLTGPIVRGDIGTLTAHLQALETSTTGLLDLYCLLGNRTVQLAEGSGRISTSMAEKIRDLLNERIFTSNTT
ncbi:MAG: DUF2520 domain-containing protein [Desulfuromonadales bacterium]|nr:DUF2520 domain-containing protein [Desulfuromonadales bacterium]